MHHAAWRMAALLFCLLYAVRVRVSLGCCAGCGQSLCRGYVAHMWRAVVPLFAIWKMRKGLSERQRNTLRGTPRIRRNSKGFQKAMLSMAKGKSPGPDGLGAEFYHSFYALIAPRLHSMLLEAQNTGSLPEAFSSRDISVLYKKETLVMSETIDQLLYFKLTTKSTLKFLSKE
eukprot:scaffold19984_cov127-Isochrysis_galbana.AAC.2